MKEEETSVHCEAPKYEGQGSGLNVMRSGSGQDKPPVLEQDLSWCLVQNGLSVNIS